MIPTRLKNTLMLVYLLIIGFSIGLVAYTLIYTPVNPDKNQMIGDWVLLINIICTCFMAGLIWTVQLVNYPLFNKIGSDQFSKYHSSHVQRITMVVALPMLLEAVTSILMLFYPHSKVPVCLLWLGIILIFIIWISTLCLQVPQHNALLNSFSDKAYGRINTTNWIRTAAWSARLALMGVIIWQIL